jgi:Protein of unknown function (DUF732)
MKRLLAATALGGALFAGSLGLAGSASADYGYDNYRFLQGLNDNGIHIINTALAISHGHTICAMLDNGNSAYDAQQWVFNADASGPLAWRGAFNYVGVAVRYYCPLHMPDIYAPDNY